jgi:hypothetical protein
MKGYGVNRLLLDKTIMILAKTIDEVFINS